MTIANRRTENIALQDKITALLPELTENQLHLLLSLAEELRPKPSPLALAAQEAAPLYQEGAELDAFSTLETEDFYDYEAE